MKRYNGIDDYLNKDNPRILSCGICTRISGEHLAQYSKFCKKHRAAYKIINYIAGKNK